MKKTKRDDLLFGKILYFSSVIFSIFVLVSIVAIGMLTWPKADDFSLIYKIDRSGIVNYIVKMYTTWDGRVISLGLFQTVFLKYLPVPIINFIWASCLIGTAFFTFKVFLYKLRSNLKMKKEDVLIGTAIIASILWYGFRSHLAETVYWATGGVYVMALFLATLWLYLWIKKFSFREKTDRLGKIFFYLFTVYIGALSQNLSSALLIFISLEFVRALSKRNKTIIKRNLFIIFLLILGLSAILIAPGNIIRAGYGPKSFIINFSAFFYNYFEILSNYSKFSARLILLAIVSFPLIILLLNFYNFKFNKQKLIELRKDVFIDLKSKKLKKIFQFFLNRCRFLIAALASVLPFIFLPDFAGARTSIYFMAFIVFWLFFEIFPFFLLKSSKLTSVREAKFNLHFIFITLFLILFSSIIFSHILSLKEAKAEFQKREIIINSYRGKGIEVVVYPINRKLPFSYSFIDIKSDKNYWVNRAVADYFGIKSIRIK